MSESTSFLLRVEATQAIITVVELDRWVFRNEAFEAYWPKFQ